MYRKSDLTFNIAFCGIIAALAVIIMFMSFIPGLAYTMPAISGIFLYTIRVHINRKWALLSYVAASFLTLVLVTQVEAQLLFVLLLGYYPIMWEDFRNIKSNFWRRILKILIFNVVAVAFYKICSDLLGINDALDGLEIFGKFALYVFWIISNVTFLLYDHALFVITLAYVKLLKPRIDKMK